MKKFLLNTSLFLLLYFAGVAAVKFIFPKKYAWGNDAVLSKKVFFDSLSSHEKFNTVFFGSSRVYRQFDPARFDSIVNENSSEKVRSFNFGYAAVYPQEAMMLCRQFVDMHPEVKTVFLETNLYPDFSSNIFSTRGGYWLNWQELITAQSIILESGKTEKAENLFYLWAGGIQNFVSIREYGYAPKIESKYLGGKYNGYFSLQDELKLYPDNKDVHDRDSIFRLDTSVVKFRSDRIAKVFANSNPGRGSNKTYVANLNELVQYCGRKGVRLYVVFTPREADSDSYQVFKTLDERNRINLCDSRMFPELYLGKNSFDDGHLNNAGAALFTSLLADQFLGKRVK